MNNVWSQEILVCQGVKYTDIPWICFKSEGPVLFVCTNLGDEELKIKICTKYRIMFLSDTFQIFNKSYIPQPEKVEEKLDLGSYVKEFEFGSVFMMDEGGLYCTRKKSKICLELVRSICDIETIEYNKFQR